MEFLSNRYQGAPYRSPNNGPVSNDNNIDQQKKSSTTRTLDANEVKELMASVMSKYDLNLSSAMTPLVGKLMPLSFNGVSKIFLPDSLLGIRKNDGAKADLDLWALLKKECDERGLTRHYEKTNGGLYLTFEKPLSASPKESNPPVQPSAFSAQPVLELFFSTVIERAGTDKEAEPIKIPVIATGSNGINKLIIAKGTRVLSGINAIKTVKDRPDYMTEEDAKQFLEMRSEAERNGYSLELAADFTLKATVFKFTPLARVAEAPSSVKNAVKLEAAENTSGQFRVADISGKSVVTIGRLDSSDCMIEDPSVSRQHARLEKSVDGTWFLVNLSQFGTRVDGSVVKEKEEKIVLLPGRYVVEAGNAKFTITIEETLQVSRNWDKDELRCPITCALIKDPVYLDVPGISVEKRARYEKKAVEEWLSKHDTDPSTNVKLASKKISEDIEMKKFITGQGFTDLMLTQQFNNLDLNKKK